MTIDERPDTDLDPTWEADVVVPVNGASPLPRRPTRARSDGRQRGAVDARYGGDRTVPITRSARRSQPTARRHSSPIAPGFGDYSQPSEPDPGLEPAGTETTGIVAEWPDRPEWPEWPDAAPEFLPMTDGRPAERDVAGDFPEWEPAVPLRSEGGRDPGTGPVADSSVDYNDWFGEGADRGDPAGGGERLLNGLGVEHPAAPPPAHRDAESLLQEGTTPPPATSIDWLGEALSDHLLDRAQAELDVEDMTLEFGGGFGDTPGADAFERRSLDPFADRPPLTTADMPSPAEAFDRPTESIPPPQPAPWTEPRSAEPPPVEPQRTEPQPAEPRSAELNQAEPVAGPRTSPADGPADQLIEAESPPPPESQPAAPFHTQPPVAETNPTEPQPARPHQAEPHRAEAHPSTGSPPGPASVHATSADPPAEPADHDAPQGTPGEESLDEPTTSGIRFDDDDDIEGRYAAPRPPRGEPIVVRTDARPVVIRDANGTLIRPRTAYDFSQTETVSTTTIAYPGLPPSGIIPVPYDRVGAGHHSDPPFDVRRALRSLALAVVVVLISAGSGYAVSSRQPEVWAATASVRYEIPAGGTFGDAERILNTEAITIRSRPVLEPIAEAEGIDVKALEAATSVELVTGSEILDVTVEDQSKSAALGLLSAIVSSYIAQSGPEDTRDGERRVLVDEIANVEAELLVAQNTLTELARRQLQEQASVAGPRTISQSDIDNAQAQVTALRDEVTSLQERLREIEIELSSVTLPASIHAEPTVLPDPVAPVPLMGAAIGALIGLAIAAVTASFLYRSGA